jgi:hypothetical protein
MYSRCICAGAVVSALATLDHGGFCSATKKPKADSVISVCRCTPAVGQEIGRH